MLHPLQEPYPGAFSDVRENLAIGVLCAGLSAMSAQQRFEWQTLEQLGTRMPATAPVPEVELVERAARVLFEGGRPEWNRELGVSLAVVNRSRYARALRRVAAQLGYPEPPFGNTISIAYTYQPNALGAEELAAADMRFAALMAVADVLTLGPGNVLREVAEALIAASGWLAPMLEPVARSLLDGALDALRTGVVSLPPRLAALGPGPQDGPLAVAMYHHALADVHELLGEIIGGAPEHFSGPPWSALPPLWAAGAAFPAQGGARR